MTATNKAAVPELLELMEQAQVFASAWSMVGGRFDSGDGVERAEEARRLLRTMLEAALAQPAAAPLSGWLPIETAPTDQRIDLLMPNGTRWTDAYFDKICDQWRVVTLNGALLVVRKEYPTHWMPLPAAPGTEADPVEQDAVREQLEALQAKCDLLSASLKKADAVRDQLMIACERSLRHYVAARGEKPDTAVMAVLRAAIKAGREQ